MAILPTSGSALALLAETTLGQTPASAFQEINAISDTLQGTKSTEVSASIRSDRQESDLTVVMNDVGGDINVQLDVVNQKSLLAALMLTDDDIAANAEQPTANNSTAIATDQNDKKYTVSAGDTDIFLGLKPGYKVKFAGFQNTDSNGVKTVASINPAGSELTVVEPIGADEAAATAPSVTWFNYINGGKKPKLNSYTIMKQYNFASALYHYFQGMVPSSLNLSLDPNSLVDATFGFVGRTDELKDAVLDVAHTISDAPQENLFATGDSLSVRGKQTKAGGLTLAGYSGDAIVYSASVSMDNQINLARSATETDAVGEAAFTYQMTGGLTLYFEDKRAYDTFSDEDEFELTFSFEDTETAEIYMPRCKFSSWSLPRPGQDQFLFVETEWKALKDNNKGYTTLLSYI